LSSNLQIRKCFPFSALSALSALSAYAHGTGFHPAVPVSRLNWTVRMYGALMY
jgi:hypothetical protein